MFVNVTYSHRKNYQQLVVLIIVWYGESVHPVAFQDCIFGTYFGGRVAVRDAQGVFIDLGIIEIEREG